MKSVANDVSNETADATPDGRTIARDGPIPFKPNGGGRRGPVEPISDSVLNAACCCNPPGMGLRQRSPNAPVPGVVPTRYVFWYVVR